jgi:4,5-DOPA dioxygenase extradiol
MSEQPRTPVLFVSHGSPLFALNPGQTGPALQQWAAEQAPADRIKGIVLISPHWMTRGGVAVMSTPMPRTWHDFGGFPDALYQLQYPAQGDPALADKVMDLLQTAGVPHAADERRPYDHGCWVPLMHLYPQADVPVVQVSLPDGFSTADIYAVGQALAPLREQGILLVASGSMTHNLYELRREDGPTEPYVAAFCGWVHDTLMQGDLASMLDYRARAPHAKRAHPSDEHFLTIYFALGAAGWGLTHGPGPVYISREVQFRTISMDAFSLH